MCSKKFIITIDTEEDNWGSFAAPSFTTENIQRIPYLQMIFDNFNVKPTYLVTYPITTDQRSVSILKNILDAGKCEIGAHCHPWNTPPFEEEKNARNSMLSNLPSDLQLKKLTALHETISNNFGIEPISFRAGRFGFDTEVAKNILKLGYKIDTSVTPFVDWSSYHGPNFSEYGWQPFRFPKDNISTKNINHQLLEVPATIDFIPCDIKVVKLFYKILSRKTNNSLKLKRFFSRIKLLQKIWLSPEMDTSTMEINLIKNLLMKGCKIFNMVFHSTSLLFGLSPFVRDRNDERKFFDNIKKVSLFFKDKEIASIKLSDVLEIHEPSDPNYQWRF